ncbi:hypothetical protein [Antricoccus suffuscus]|uniref:alpha/beta hydrolase family protein n=1 Tax=Antricoccus suffuscus TaxID=1629062 RepID=UPI000D0692D4|nr:hypothetical protein [Antricoccus suffuscus]
MPDTEEASLGVLLCASVGEEEHNAHETFRELAYALATQGIASLRFDYHGTGDSMGSWTDPGRVEAWIGSVQTAHESLREIGVSKVAAVGMRFGASLVTAATQRGLIDLDALVLWDPCGGKSLLREGQARRPSQREPAAGAADTPGYLYSPDTSRDMRELSVASLPPGDIASRLLVLTRDDRPTPRALRRRLDGGDTEWGPAVGQEDLLDLPMTDNAVPMESLGRIVLWLQEIARHPPQHLRARLTQKLTLSADEEGRLLTERVVSLGRIGLFGVVTEPARLRRAPTVVLINVANDRHVGPGRRWVDYARLWAVQGFRVLRMDQSGAGDSPCHEGQRFGVLYAREWLGDMPEALRSEELAGSPVVLISLCSGAYSAMETAFQEHVAAIYAINVILHATVTSKASDLHDSRRVAARPPIAPILRLYAARPRLAALLWRMYRQVTVWNAPMAAVSALTRKGTDVILVVSPNDGRHFTESAYWTAFHTWRMRRSGRYRMLRSAEIDHPLMTQEGQNCAMSAISADLLSRFPVRPEGVPEQDAPDSYRKQLGLGRQLT